MAIVRVGAVVVTIAGCGGDDGRADGSEGGILSVGGHDDATGGGSSGATGGGVKLDLPDGADTTATSAGAMECASQVTAAENQKQPADIVVVVDNSGSMDFEAASVQSNLNGFSQQIVDSGIDVHVVLISSYPGDGNGICIDPPLGSSGCNDADNNPPLFTHIDSRVASHDALVQILDHEPEWKQVRRPDAALHFVVVSDDESEIGVLEFDDGLKALDPSYALYKLNGIVCTTECDETANIGMVYISLGQLTGGIISDLCLQDFQPVFDQLATLVIEGAQIACEWDVPQPPEGEDFDPQKVNVRFDDGMGGGFDIGYVDGPAACGGVIDGWYYDDPVAPTKILACPQTCPKIQGIDTGTIEITLGCDTIPAG